MGKPETNRKIYFFCYLFFSFFSFCLLNVCDFESLENLKNLYLFSMLRGI